MSLPVVLKSGKNYITLVLDKELSFSDLLSHIIGKFVENASFFEGGSFAIMFEGRELDDREKNIILDAIEEYTNVHIKMLIENDEYREYAAVKLAYDKAHNSRFNELTENNCLFVDKDICTGEKIFGANNVIVNGNVETGAIVKAGNSIAILGRLDGQALAGTDEKAEAPFIMAKEFCPENFRIGSNIGKYKKKSSGIFSKKPSTKIATLVDGELSVKPYKY